MRVFLIVIDSFGIGEAPDAAEYGDEGCNTYVNVVRKTGVTLPNLIKLGLNDIDGVRELLPPVGNHTAAVARLRELSAGKDTTTGHWEIAGIVTERPFPLYPGGFPKRITDKLEAAFKKKILCNTAISGTDAIDIYGPEHMVSGCPIVYTSADSVLQIAAHTGVVPLETLYGYCIRAREIMSGKDAVGRIIARPFTTKDGRFVRTADRRDYSLTPPRDTVLDILQKRGAETIAVGKIEDIFAGNGIDGAIHTQSNAEGLSVILRLINRRAMNDNTSQFVFANLVDTDMLYGHRNDPEGYARALLEIDGALPAIMGAAREDDIIIITADHGCDPTADGTDHSREYVPLLIWGKGVKPENLGTIDGFDYVSKYVINIFGNVNKK